MMVEVFKTNVPGENQGRRLLRQLLEHFPECRISFDLEDCDKVLRVEGALVITGKIIALLAGAAPLSYAIV